MIKSLFHDIMITENIRGHRKFKHLAVILRCIPSGDFGFGKNKNADLVRTEG